MTSNNTLDALAFPLYGTRLIEASAGTGKTYTIAALYVRLILGHDIDKAFRDRQLFPPDILVVTFTEAATKELRDRIRSRLSQAARYFNQLSEDNDEFLEQLRASYLASEWPSCAYRLKLAADWMDEAAVYTIHGWCNRMLQQHAFDSGSLFRQEVDNDDLELLNEVVRDYWRTVFYPLTEIQCLAVYQLARTPEELAKAIKPLLSETEAQGLEGDEDSITNTFKDWEKWEQKRSSLEYLARLSWYENKEEIEKCLLSALENHWLNGNQYRLATFGNKLGALSAWAQGELPLDIAALEKFGQQKLIAGLVKAHADKAEQIQHTTFQAIDHLVQHTSQEIDIGKKLSLHALNWIRNRYDTVKQRAARITFDDMLTRLDKALQGDNGKQLVSVIRQQYPVALFDEFQDTDATQYRIISTLYSASTNTDLGCFMIGDPKQAIYSFRGADIFTYLKAHRATSGRHYTLGTNFRSTADLVNAVNQVFMQADRQTEGAFRFKCETENPLPFLPVDAKGRDEEWVIDNHKAAALALWHWETSDPIGMPDYRETMAEAAASEIVRLLNKAKQGNTGFKTQSGKIRPIQPSDIAILVRSGTEARVMRSALASRQLRSVYLSERDSIYATPEAVDLLLWLKAMADPRKERKVRTALSTATIGWPYQTLQQLTQDELSWEQHLERFLGYRHQWEQDGILPTLRQFINDYGLYAHWPDNSNGERCLTNLLHLSELLQQASGQFEGKQALIRHLAEEILNGDQSNEENVIRLESDANLIKVITIHKSKGLEYPLVFLPFVCSFREISSRNNTYYRYHDANQNLCIDLDKIDANKSISDSERHQEDIRLLYVAMTRAQVACWLGIAPIKSGNTKICQLEKSAVGYLLGWQAGMPATALKGQLAQLKGNCTGIAITPPPSTSQDVYVPSEQQEKLGLSRLSTAKITDNWWIASYSALQTEKKQLIQSDTNTKSFEPETAQDDKRNDEADITIEPLSKALVGIHSVARGASTGILIHELLEQCARVGFKAVQSSPELQKQLINKVFNHSTWEDKRDILATALTQWLTMPLLENTEASLCNLATDQYQAEMEFLLGADNVDVSTLDHLVTQQTFIGSPRPRLLQAQVHGLLKGFIDLVFVHNQKYYIADYKFNALGSNDAAYTQETLETAMLERRYDLQYTLYLLALHRLLKSRLGNDYDYDTHIGGAVYLFLRGTNALTCGRVFDKPPKSLIDALDSLFSGFSIHDQSTYG
jgi:exodeoxyribonuclease V beta subunit